MRYESIQIRSSIFSKHQQKAVLSFVAHAVVKTIAVELVLTIL